MAKKKIVYVSAAALVDGQNRVLLAQRPAGRSMAGLWEFPGGKIETGETPECALMRELDEELGITVQAKDMTPLAFASHDYSDFHLFMPVFLVRAWQGKMKANEGQGLAWATAEELVSYDMPPADVPLIPDIQRALQHAHDIG
ncbi:MAG: 8-oxo-dGTP diphosphatase MutT [Alphaproteobacteria bacterium]|nr:8-oxo-dGTP diphosphatase MutT [Alphaproteobacteria bacterium]